MGWKFWSKRKSHYWENVNPNRRGRAKYVRVGRHIHKVRGYRKDKHGLSDWSLDPADN